MSSANLTRDETAARAAGIRLHTVEVELDLRAARDADAATFATASTLVFAASVPDTWIDFVGESVDDVTVNGVPQPVVWDGARVHITGLAADNTVTIRARGRYSSSGRGCIASATRSTTRSTSTRSTSRRTVAGCILCSSSPTSRRAGGSP